VLSDLVVKQVNLAQALDGEVLTASLKLENWISGTAACTNDTRARAAPNRAHKEPRVAERKERAPRSDGDDPQR
jgi:hypothetical protein